jgi:two-component system, NtrC family, sensor kinase
MEPGAKPAKAKIEARPSVRRKSRKVDGSLGWERDERLAGVLAQLTAISEILRVISASPSDVQPVLEAVAQRAAHLCQAPFSRMLIIQGSALNAMADYSVEGESPIPSSPVPLKRTSISGRAALDRETIHYADIVPLLDSEFPDARQNQQRTGFRAVLAVPLVRDDVAYGAILLWRRVPGLFSSDQVAFVETFAQQAVIAIENVRLFNETKEALERQTATSEVLEAISGAQTDASPVFETIARNAHRLSAAVRCNVLRYDDGLLHIAAVSGFSPEDEQQLRRRYPVKPGDASVMSGRVILSGSVEKIDDALSDPLYDQEHASNLGLRRMLGVPMLRGGAVLGVIVLAWRESGPTPAALIELLKTFAEQAVIAIENVRLFTELDARTAQLTRSVAELKALGEVGQAVSSTLDLEIVLRTIVSRATELAGMDAGSVYEYDTDREEFYLHTPHLLPTQLVEALRAKPIRKGEGALGQMAITGEPVQIKDIANDRAYQSGVRKQLIEIGCRSLLVIPLLRENMLIGGLAVYRKSAGEFAPQVIELLKTFATQSALAIQNARLFREIEDKSRQLEVASQHKSEFLANMSHELRTPLNAIIGFSEVLAERMFGEINDKQAEYLADILESGRHLLSLINDILDLSKIEAGRMELQATEFSLPDAIENTLTLVRERAHRHGIALGHRVDERLGTICADERKVKQVLLNLLSNALKFTPEGGRIDVVATVTDNAIEISVSDTGVGIAAEDQAMVFEEFRQVGAASKKIEGTGLGLAISRKFIELHGGKIWVKSQVGAGSTFAFTLPLQ